MLAALKLVALTLCRRLTIWRRRVVYYVGLLYSQSAAAAATMTFLTVFLALSSRPRPPRHDFLCR